jgi:hypothetical protein
VVQSAHLICTNGVAPAGDIATASLAALSFITSISSRY